MTDKKAPVILERDEYYITPDPPATLYEALLAVQAEAPRLQKTAINPHFGSRFVPLQEVHEAVMPIINKNGLVWLTKPGMNDYGPCLDYKMVHVASGEMEEGSISLLPSKTDPQGQGSAITYARRYALMAVLGLTADADDDGNAASGEPKKDGGNFKVTKNQIEKFILPSLKRAKLSDNDLHAILVVRFKVGRVEDLPRGKADALVKAFDDPVPVLRATAADSDVPPDTEGLEQPPLGDDDVPWER